jgi:hypothetical protein
MGVRERSIGIVLSYTDKKENKIFLIYKEIQSGAVAKLYMRKCFLNMRKCALFPHL